MGGLLFWAVVLGMVVLVGTWYGSRSSWRGHKSGQSEGWVYFVTAPGNDEAPVKIGYTHRDPTADRLPELRTMSPFPLRIIFKFKAPDVRIAEKAVHRQLDAHRLHGEWFDRDATLAFIDHLKGEF